MTLFKMEELVSFDFDEVIKFFDDGYKNKKTNDLKNELVEVCNLIQKDFYDSMIYDIVKQSYGLDYIDAINQGNDSPFYFDGFDFKKHKVAIFKLNSFFLKKLREDGYTEDYARIFDEIVEQIDFEDTEFKNYSSNNAMIRLAYISFIKEIGFDFLLSFSDYDFESDGINKTEKIEELEKEFKILEEAFQKAIDEEKFKEFYFSKEDIEIYFFKNITNWDFVKYRSKKRRE